MMTNLFSTFDPASSTSWSLNWLSLIFSIILLNYNFWSHSSKITKMKMMVYNKLHQEFKLLLNNLSQGFTLMFIILFTLILINNLMGLTPYTFTASSHMTFTLSLSLPIWLTLMIFGWKTHTQHMFAHLIPEGSPLGLAPFMACIETISNIIRPGSLAVRLTANMIAGHLLMCLLGNSMMKMNNSIISFTIIMQISLMMFETAVAIIQAYVFSILTTLYTTEVTYDK